MLEEELPCIRYDGWGNLTPSGYFKFDLGVCLLRAASSALDPPPPDLAHGSVPS